MRTVRLLLERGGAWQRRMRPSLARGERAWMLRVANSTPMVLLDSRQNSLRVKRDSRLDLPTPESPMSTTLKRWS